MEQELGRIDYRNESVSEMTNRHLISSIRVLHFFRYKSEDQQKTYQILMKELNKRQISATI